MEVCFLPDKITGRVFVFFMKIFRTFAFSLSLFLLLATPVFAQFTLLPSTDEDALGCDILLDNYEISGEIPTIKQLKEDKALSAAASSERADEAFSSYDASLAELCSIAGKDGKQDEECQGNETFKANKDSADANAEKYTKEMNDYANDTRSARNDLLACAIKTGRITFQMAPYFITYVSDFVLSLIGLVSVLFIVLGGYYYIYGGLTDQKEKGKKTIQHALMGMSLAILAWVIVGAIMSIVTGA